MFAEPEPQELEIYQHLYQIYPDIPQYSEEHKRIQKYQTINKRFSFLYGKEPKYFVKCPGSLVLFGDSADYSGFSHIECCTPNDIVIVLAQNNSKQLRINHFQKSRYPEEKISLAQAELKENSEFRNNIILALRVNKGLKIKVEEGLDILIYSDLLDRSDLSKTTAFIYCFILGILAISGTAKTIKKQKIIEELKKYKEVFPSLQIREAPMYAYNNKLVDPSTKQGLNFIKGYTFVLAHSCTPNSPKLIQIKEGKKSNLKRCEVRLGIQIIKVEVGIEKDICTLKQLKDNLGYSIQQFLECVEEYIPNKPLLDEQIQAITEKSLIQLLKQIPFSNNVIEHFKSFYPYNPITYILKEELIIQQLKTLLQSNVQQSLKAQKIKGIFQHSWRLQKQHLVPPSEQVNKLLQVAGQIPEGKYFKVVGDSTKGNVLFFLQKHNVQKLIEHLSKQYYDSKEMRMLLSDSIDQYVYEVIPSMGASILDPQYQIWL